MAVPVPAAARLLVALHRHAAERDLHLHGGLRQSERERDVEGFLVQRGWFGDPVLDVHPRQVVVQRHDGRDGGTALQRPLDHEAGANAGKALAPRGHERRLLHREIGCGPELVARRRSPERAVGTTLHVQKLVQSRPRRRADALLAIARRERADRTAGRVEHDVETPRLGLERRAVVPGRVGGPLALCGHHIAQGRDVPRHHERRAVGKIHRGPVAAVCSKAPPARAGDPHHVGPRPGRGVEDDSTRAGRAAEADAQQSGRDLVGGGSGPALQQVPLVRPLCNHLSAIGIRSAVPGYPVVVAEHQ